jgi:hypothetical protein
VERADESRAGIPNALHLRAARVHRTSVRALARALENMNEPVTAAGMLRVTDLVTRAGSPLWGASSDGTLRDAVCATLAILRPRRVDAAA